ncbi:MAG: pyridoxal phosphate-dependent aminotransferase [Acidobacteria bacterium]|nr:pyridoxal phosphate-dependent aminotransferase [Acidobacteriota bacterium]MBV9477576.1 pyridoxal phosphate-dependent aminotransferase [Acidobacteriota bacterium]
MTTTTPTTRPAIRFSERVTAMQESPTLAVLNRATARIAEGVDVVDFGAGEPDFGTPSSIAAAGKRAIDEGLTKYTNASGLKSLREAIARRYNRRYGTSLGAEHVIAGNGGKQELFNLALALVRPGDEVIIPSPYWVSFPDQVSFAGGTPVFAPADPAEGFRPRLQDIEAVATSRTRGVILNSPCNPTGAVIRESELARIVEWCVARDAFLVFDETYELFVYGGHEHASAMRWFEQYPETIAVVNSMSKTFAMTGWRLGYAVAHPDIVTALGKIQSHSTSNPSTITQMAALAALDGANEDVQRMYDAYRDRRAWLVPAINGIPGICCTDPDGAFYIFPDVSAYFGKRGITDSQSVASYLLDEARVAVVPGGAFGADDYIRISYATSMERIREGVARMDAALRKL